MCGAVVPAEKENCNRILSLQQYAERFSQRKRGAEPLFKSEKPKSMVRRVWLGLFADKGIRALFEIVAAATYTNVIRMNWMLERNRSYGRIAFVTGIAFIII